MNPHPNASLSHHGAANNASASHHGTNNGLPPSNGNTQAVGLNGQSHSGGTTLSQAIAHSNEVALNQHHHAQQATLNGILSGQAQAVLSNDAAALQQANNAGRSETPADDANDEDLMHELESDVGGNGGSDRQPVAEFLYQLTKLLTDDNSDVIEWSDGRIKVHDPLLLEQNVLHKYFRHSKFASFQRQLNYFQFRKIAGKGKMSPCSYVNDSASTDIRSLLLIKRKTNGSAARKAAIQQQQHRSINPLLGLNLQSLATGQMGLANLGAQGFGDFGGPMGGQSLANAMALLSDSALRTGLEQLQSGNGLTNQQLGLFALQQHQQQQQQQQQFQQLQQQLQQNQQAQQQPQYTLQQHLQMHQNYQAQQQQQQQQSSQHNHNQLLQGMQAQKSLLQSSSLEQLAQLTAQLHSSQQSSGNAQNNGNQSTDAMSASSIRAAASSLQALQNNVNMLMNSKNAPAEKSASAPNPASAALAAQQSAAAPVNNPASAALQAMDSGSSGPAATSSSNNLFESALNLKSLLQEHQESNARNQAANANNNHNNQGASARLHERISSNAGIFPENFSSISLGNLLGSSNRLNSLLSLNSLMGSREPSLADFAALNGMHQFPYHAQFPGPSTTNGNSAGNAPMSAADLAQRLRQANYSSS